MSRRGAAVAEAEVVAGLLLHRLGMLALLLSRIPMRVAADEAVVAAAQDCSLVSTLCGSRSMARAIRSRSRSNRIRDKCTRFPTVAPHEKLALHAVAPHWRPLGVSE
jgi:hypothetical protein